MRRSGPLWLVGVAGTATVVLEAATTSYARYGVEAAVTGAALAFAWRRRAEVRRWHALVPAFLLPVAIGLAHIARGVEGDGDLLQIYAQQGQELLDGHYPHSEYPPLAVFLFAAERGLGDVHVANVFLMAACHLAVAASVAHVRRPDAPWAALALAVWPLNAFFWEFKYDLLPTALLTVGLVLALRERWAAAGVVLALGTLAKWTPATAVVVLALWLVATRSHRAAVRLVGAFVATLAVVWLPLLAWDAGAVEAAVTRQASRDITHESVWYLVLDAVGQAAVGGAIHEPARVPEWANAAAVAVQVAVLAALAVALAARRVQLPAAVAGAAIAPALFLLLNKIFSAQFLVTICGGCVLAAVVLLSAGRLAAVVAALGLASGFNLLVYPIARAWEPASAVMFGLALAGVGVVAAAALSAKHPRAPWATVP